MMAECSLSRVTCVGLVWSLMSAQRMVLEGRLRSRQDSWRAPDVLPISSICCAEDITTMFTSSVAAQRLLRYTQMVFVEQLLEEW